MFHNNNLNKRHALAAATFAFLSVLSASSFAVSLDPVVFTFSTVGDSRQDNAAPDASVVNNAQVGVGACPSTSAVSGLVANPGLSGQDCKWLQNTKAWSRIIRTIQSQKANMLFFNGDMIMGYGLADIPVTRAGSVAIPKPTSATPLPADTETAQPLTISTPASIQNVVTSDLMQFYQQYSFWRGMVANLMETGTYVVPVPGNHETQCKRCGKKSQWQNENAWRDNMGDLILDTNRLASLLPNGLSLGGNWSVSHAPSATDVFNGATNPDGIYTSQQQLSYSFDIGSYHFAVINTDPVGNDGHAPSNWLDDDLSKAVANGANNLFVFGHKPAYYYSYVGSAPSSSSSLFLTNSAAGDYFWSVISKHNATYFSGHEHIYNVSQPVSNSVSTGGNAYQVIVGAGGSPFDDFESSTTQVFPTGTLATDRMYSWATVSVYKSGKAVMNTYGFDASMANPIQNLGTFTLPAAK